jgi:hypothetical protein
LHLFLPTTNDKQQIIAEHLISLKPEKSTKKPEILLAKELLVSNHINSIFLEQIKHIMKKFYSYLAFYWIAPSYNKSISCIGTNGT